MVIKENQPNSKTSTTEDNKEVKTKTDEQPPKEENKKEETKTETKTDNKEQPTKEEKEEKEVTYKESLAKVVAQFKAELKKEREEHKRDVDERDGIIAQLVTDTKASPKSISGCKSIRERIAERRNYKKW